MLCSDGREGNVFDESGNLSIGGLDGTGNVHIGLSFSVSSSQFNSGAGVGGRYIGSILITPAGRLLSRALACCSKDPVKC